MRKIFCATLFLFLFICILQSQSCINSGETLTLSSQIEIDEFPINYPNCTIIDGHLTIEGTDITNLNGLSVLTEISGTLRILNNEALISLEGLNNLSLISSFYLINNPLLLNLNGLNNLSTIRGRFEIQNNDALVNLIGLDSLSKVNGAFNINSNDQLENFIGLNENLILGDYYGLSITFNNSLINLKGLEGISSAYSLIIRDNESLENLSGLDNFTATVLGFTISKNNSLTNVSNLKSLTSVGAELQIIDNPSLEHLDGLENLISIGENYSTFRALVIQNNASLKNLAGLINLTTITSAISIKNNESLETIQGFQKLSVIEGYTSIENNDALKNLEGLENITSFDQIRIVDNDMLLNLNGLNGLDTINWDIYISDNDQLQSLEGLENLSTIVYACTINNNAALKSLESLESLTSIGRYLEIYENNALENLNGLKQLSSIGSYFLLKDNPSLKNIKDLKSLSSINGYLEVNNNDALERLEGLENLSFINGNLRIRNNESLKDMTALEKAFQYYLVADTDNTSITYITIRDNPNLTICAFFSFCRFLDAHPSNSSISSNGDGCKYRSQILNSCNDLEGKVHITVFNDKNLDGIFNHEDDLATGIPIHVSPFDMEILSNSYHGADLHFLEDGTYTFTYDQLAVGDRWMLTTNSTSYDISIDDINKCDTVLFGVQAIPYSEVTTFSSSASARCNEYVSFFINANNSGTTNVSGTLWLNIDTAVEDYELVSNNEPDTINDQKIGWNFDNLPPGTPFKKKINLLVPGPPAFELGNELFFETTTEYEDELGTHSEKTIYSTPVLCSWDPNDKLVQPARDGNYTLFDEDLIYTIRFQNTGNAEAYHVSIKDTLDANLDLRTFRVLDTSHPDKLTTTIEANRFVSFNFDYIYLPDSTSNPEGSQGYVTYTIKSQQGLDENTLIENTASIYFDANPPIVTNTTQNQMVTCLPYEETSVEVLINYGEVYILPDGIQVSEAGTYQTNILDEEGCIIELITTILEVCTAYEETIVDVFIYEGEMYTLPNGMQVSEAGTYETSIIDENGCIIELITTNLEVILTNTQNLTLDYLLELSPNPNSGIFNLNLKSNITSSYQVILYDIMGQQVYQQVWQSNHTLIKANHLPSGVYTLQLKTDKGKILALKKMVIQD